MELEKLLSNDEPLNISTYHTLKNRLKDYQAVVILIDENKVFLHSEIETALIQIEEQIKGLHNYKLEIL